MCRIYRTFQVACFRTWIKLHNVKADIAQWDPCAWMNNGIRGMENSGNTVLTTCALIPMNMIVSNLGELDKNDDETRRTKARYLKLKRQWIPINGNHLRCFTSEKRPKFPKSELRIRRNPCWKTSIKRAAEMSSEETSTSDWKLLNF